MLPVVQTSCSCRCRRNMKKSCKPSPATSQQIHQHINMLLCNPSTCRCRRGPSPALWLLRTCDCTFRSHERAQHVSYHKGMNQLRVPITEYLRISGCCSLQKKTRVASLVPIHAKLYRGDPYLNSQCFSRFCLIKGKLRN